MTEPASPPASIEAEQELLGSILVSNEGWYQASEIIGPEHFYEDLHARIFEIIGTVMARGKTATAVIVDTYLRDYPGYDDVGGSSYLVHLAAAAVSVVNIRSYARTIFELATLRGLMAVGEEIWSAAQTPDAALVSASDLIERAEQALYQLGEKGRYGRGFAPFREAARHAVDMAEAAMRRDGNLSGLPTGLTDLDALMGGLQPSDLIVLAGRPAMGKTSLATNIAAHAARKGPVGVFSLEMSGEQLATRVLSGFAGISSHRVRRGKIGETDFRRIVEAVRATESLPLHIDDTGGLSVAQVAARARRLHRQVGLILLVLDYLQLLQPAVRRPNASRVNEITEITQGLKALAKELDVPLIALSQLSRAVEQRDDKRPQLADLRESGSIEQDADVVLFVYREEYYHDMRRPDGSDAEKLARWEEKAEAVKGLAEIIIGKQRHGPVGTVEVQFDAELTTFSTLARG